MDLADRRLARLYVLALILAMLLVGYENTFHSPFIFDDEGAIQENHYMRHWWPITSPFMAPDETTLAGRPVVCLTFAINYALGGYEVEGYHAVNLALHFLVGCLLWAILRRTLQLPNFKKTLGEASDLLALNIAILWLVHPLQTEAVTYIVQRTELVMSLFYLGTLYCSIRAWDTPRPMKWQIAAVVACALGMASKEVMVSAPVMVVLYDWAFRERSLPRLLTLRAPFYASLGATWVILVLLLLTGPRDQSVGFGLETEWWNYLLGQCRVILRYLELCLVPARLCVDYGQAHDVKLTWLNVVPGGVVIAILLTVTFLGWIFRPWIGFLGCWFFFILAPTSSFVPIATEVGAERRMYLPLVSVLVVLVIGLFFLVQMLVRLIASKAEGSPRASLFPLAVILMIWAGALTLTTASRNYLYGDVIRLWEDTVAKRPTNPRARLSLANALTKAGKFDQGEAIYRELLTKWPMEADVHNGLGVCLFFHGKENEALQCFNRVLEINPKNFHAHKNMALALEKLDRGAEAVEHYKAALETRPLDFDTHYKLGFRLTELGRNEEAIAEFNKALELAGESSAAHNSMAVALINLGRLEEAMQHFNEATRIEPDNPDPWYNLGFLLANQKRYSEAIEYLKKTIQVQPSYAKAYNTLGVVLIEQGNLEEGVKLLETAVQIDPNLADARRNLIIIYRKHGKPELAAPHEEALQRIQGGTPVGTPSSTFPLNSL